MKPTKTEKTDEYKEGYTEAISDLYRGFYEEWVSKEEGDYVIMINKILNLQQENTRLKDEIKELHYQLKDLDNQCGLLNTKMLGIDDENIELRKLNNVLYIENSTKRTARFEKEIADLKKLCQDKSDYINFLAKENARLKQELEDIKQNGNRTMSKM